MDFTSNYFLLIVIVAYLVYSLIKTRKKSETPEKKNVVLPKETAAIAKDTTDYEKHVLAAVISALMQDKRYVVKRIFAVGTVDEKKSAWKVSGRQENMNRRLFFRKK